jgi:glutathione S-transferase
MGEVHDQELPCGYDGPIGCLPSDTGDVLMSEMTLYIGSKSLSSWSMRPWLLLRHHGCRFREEVIALDQPDTRARLLEHSPSGRVPVLVDGALRVWESLAICEYAAETLVLPGAWPADRAARAFARSAAAEMHASFAALRRELPFDATRDPAAKSVSGEVQADIARICAIWREAMTLHRSHGDWLCGAFGIIDAMYAPVALRFHGYAVTLPEDARAYVAQVLAHPQVQRWIESAAMEQAAATVAEPPKRSRSARPAATETKAPQTGVRSVILPAD